MLDTIKGWLSTRVERDGQAPALERGLPVEAPTPDGTGGPRDRRNVLPGSPQDVLDGSLAGKILEGWSQNQLQTLVPLTLRLDKLGEAATALLMRFAAVACLAGPDGEGDRTAPLARWLRSIGADDRAIAAFTASLERDDGLGPLLRAIRAERLEPQAYAVAVMATDPRHPAGRLFANYVAARLDLPAEAIRSIDRRHRR